jgi:hypothetical protein
VKRLSKQKGDILSKQGSRRPRGRLRRTTEAARIGQSRPVWNAASAIVSALATGELTPGEASEVAKAVNVFTQAISNADIEQRLGKAGRTVEGEAVSCAAN